MMFFNDNVVYLKNRFIMYSFISAMGLFGKKNKENETKCKVCDLELHQPERLERHMKKAHGNVPEKKPDTTGGVQEGGMW